MAKDLYVSYFLEDNPSQQNYFSFGFDTPRAVDGLTKLLVVFLKDLFTIRGSDIYDREAGTLLGTIIGGNVANIDDVEDIVSLSVSDSADNVRRYQTSSMLTDEERIGVVELVELEIIEPDGVAAKIRVQNAVGRSLVASLPVT